MWTALEGLGAADDVLDAMRRPAIQLPGKPGVQRSAATGLEQRREQTS
jgi:hypothetical protein